MNQLICKDISIAVFTIGIPILEQLMLKTHIKISGPHKDAPIYIYIYIYIYI